MVTPLDELEVEYQFRSRRPTVADFTAARDGHRLISELRWNGHYATLYDDSGRPAALAFWGHSGD